MGRPFVVVFEVAMSSGTPTRIVDETVGLAQMAALRGGPLDPLQLGDGLEPSLAQSIDLHGPGLLEAFLAVGDGLDLSGRRMPSPYCASGPLIAARAR
jgi:hypothetical protein